MVKNEPNVRMAVAMLRRIEAELALPYMPPEVVCKPLFVGAALMLGTQTIDSLDLIEAMVSIDEDLGVLMLDRAELRAAGTLQGIAELVLAKADSGAVEHFCEKWALVGIYKP
jgi:hypothetical protein